MHWFLKFIFGMKLYMFRTVHLSNISSFPLYTKKWYISYILRAGSVHLGGFNISIYIYIFMLVPRINDD